MTSLYVSTYIARKPAAALSVMSHPLLVACLAESNLRCDNPSFQPTIFFKPLEEVGVYAASATWFHEHYVKSCESTVSQLFSQEGQLLGGLLVGQSYRHHRGQVYELQMVAVHAECETRQQIVLYKNAEGVQYSRPLKEFVTTFVLCDA